MDKENGKEEKKKMGTMRMKMKAPK